MEKGLFSSDKSRLEGLEILMRHSKMVMFTYCQETDTMEIYDAKLQKTDTICGVLYDAERKNMVCPEDYWKLQEFLEGRLQGAIEIRVQKTPGAEYQMISMDALVQREDGFRIGSMKNVTQERRREEIWQDQAQRDSLTGLYNNQTGKILISEYLAKKAPFSSCGMMVIDIDFFKNINDNYGHLFGDEVLTKFAAFLRTFFAEKDIFVRAGGDEFVVLLKEISHQDLLKKSMQFVQLVRKIRFSQQNVTISCSAGVCFLPENVAGYTYEQLFENADWALYQAKINGRNRYVFCDNLKRFELEAQSVETDNIIDTRYLRNDVVATAFEIFEKQNSFDTAMELLLQVIGIRFQLDRITVLQTDIKKQSVRQQYQWLRTATEESSGLTASGSFSRENFQTLFRSYDEYGTTVLQHDNMGMYSPEGQQLLMQGDAKTVLYAAMYCEGKYVGAISYVVCTSERYWSKQDRKQLGELTKIVSVHMAKSQAINAGACGQFVTPGLDALTGLLTYARFCEEVERIIAGGYAGKHLMIYTDFCGFKYFNQKYGYTAGDILLKEFANYIMERMPEGVEGYFARIAADQFLLFMPYEHMETAAEKVSEINAGFQRKVEARFPGANIKMRTGIYRISENCMGAAMAVDAANYARKQIRENSEQTVVLYDEKIRLQQDQENEIIGSMDEAMRQEEFCVFYQPKVSLTDYRVVGAEALIRWIRKDGTVLTPNAFVPLYEKNGRIVELDYYVLEKTAQMLQNQQKKGLPVVPVSVNVSALHAADENTVDKYLAVLQKYNLSPALFQVEITESATVFNYHNVRQMFARFQQAGFTTALDDFGAGFSIMNLIADIPLDVVKLDRIFVEKCEYSKRGDFFLHQVIQLLKGLGFTVLSEGVERKDQAEMLGKAGCDLMQGNWFSAPVPGEEFAELL